jgi:hypothetical protein
MGVEDNFKTIIIGLVVVLAVRPTAPDRRGDADRVNRPGGPVVASSDRIGYKNGL